MSPQVKLLSLLSMERSNIWQHRNNKKVDNISVSSSTDLDTLSSNVATNNAKVSSQWSNNGSEVYIKM